MVATTWMRRYGVGVRVDVAVGVVPGGGVVGGGVGAVTGPVPGSNAPVMSVFGSSAGRRAR
jgi:hypothetical protein